MLASLRAAAVAAASLILIPTASSAQATAQAAHSPWRVFAGVAFGSVYDDEGSLGNGPEVSVGIGHALTPRWSVEGVAFRHAHERTDAFRVDADVTGVIGRIAVHFGAEEAPARFFLAGGVGVARHGGTVGFVGGPPESPVVEPRRSFSATGLVTEIGLGVDVSLGRRVFLLRPQVRARWSSLERPDFGPEPPYLSGLAGVSVGWRR